MSERLEHTAREHAWTDGCPQVPTLLQLRNEILHLLPSTQQDLIPTTSRAAGITEEHPNSNEETSQGVLTPEVKMNLSKRFVTFYHVSKGGFPPGVLVSTQGSIYAAWFFNLLFIYFSFHLYIYIISTV